jgi:large subunit ribosomal protein L28
VAAVCDICKKSHVVGNIVSHAHNKSKRRFSPNLKSVRARVNGANRRIRVCTRCIRSGRVQKAV